MSTILLVLCTCPDRSTALTLATALVEMKVAACVSVQPQVTSVYRWHDHIEQTDECLLFIKTNAACYQDLEQAIRLRHPYTTPEIIAVPIERGLSSYLSWVEQCTNI